MVSWFPFVKYILIATAVEDGAYILLAGLIAFFVWQLWKHL
jgi:hypothetical protein